MKGIKNSYNSIFKSKVPKIDKIKAALNDNKILNTENSDNKINERKSKYKLMTKNGRISKTSKNHQFNNKLVNIYQLFLDIQIK